MGKGFGTWMTLVSTGAGPVSAGWSLPPRASGTIAIYAGNRFAGPANPVRLSPPPLALVTRIGKGGPLAAATTSVAPGRYTVYFYAGSSVSARAGSVGAVSSTCPLPVTMVARIPVRLSGR
jgi:hypothetical protein